MADFVSVPAETLEKWLADQKFERTVHGNEVVYVRSSVKNPCVKMKVYTSIRVGQVAVRAAGKDAIRVCVAFENGARSFGIGKFPSVPRVHSVESVLRRTKERLMEAAKRANEWIAQDEAREAERAARFKEQHPDIQQKNRFARREAFQESQAFLLDPDFQDPCSEPPPALFEGE